MGPVEAPKPMAKLNRVPKRPGCQHPKRVEQGIGLEMPVDWDLQRPESQHPKRVELNWNP